MAIVEEVVYAEETASQHGGTIASVDTTDCDLLIFPIASYAPNTVGTEAPTDSETNDIDGLTLYESTSSSIRLFYATDPGVSATHTVTYSDSNSFPVIGIVGYSGADTTAPFDQENGASTGAGSPLSPGSVTPSEDNELIVTAIAIYGTRGTVSIDDGFTIISEVGVNPTLVIATKVQTTAAAENPEWSWTGSATIAVATIATFKAATPPAGGTGSAALVFPAFAFGGDATFSAPVYEADANLTFPVLVFTGDAIYDAGTFTASADLSFPAFVFTGGATFTPPVYEADANLIFPAFVFAGSASFSENLAEASADLDFPEFTFAGNAEFSAETKTASADLDFPAFTFASAATYDAGTFTASADLTFPSFVFAGEATYSSGTRNASADLTFPAFTFGGDATFTAPSGTGLLVHVLAHGLYIGQM